MPLFGSQVPNHEIFVLKFAPIGPRIFFDKKSLGLPMKCSQPWAVWPTWRVGAPGAKELLDDRSLGTGNQPLPPGSEQHSFSKPHMVVPACWLWEKSWLKMMVLIGNVGCIDGVSCIMLYSMTRDGWRWRRCFFWTGILAARSKRNN